jgi:hypothetical protein
MGYNSMEFLLRDILIKSIDCTGILRENYKYAQRQNLENKI